jgi:hypothetical protein
MEDLKEEVVLATLEFKTCKKKDKLSYCKSLSNNLIKLTHQLQHACSLFHKQ